MAKTAGQTIKKIMQSGANNVRPFWMEEDYCPEDTLIAAQAAAAMSERLGVDIAIMADLQVIPLKDAKYAPLEIVRCPGVLKRTGKKVWHRYKPDSP
jgi:pyruvate kinase